MWRIWQVGPVPLLSIHPNYSVEWNIQQQSHRWIPVQFNIHLNFWYIINFSKYIQFYVHKFICDLVIQGLKATYILFCDMVDMSLYKVRFFMVRSGFFMNEHALCTKHLNKAEVDGNLNSYSNLVWNAMSSAIAERHMVLCSTATAYCDT